jgi:endonuclease-3
MTKEQKVQAIFDRLYKIWPHPKTELIWHSPVQLLVAVMLSAQATDKSVNLATPALFAKYPTVQDFANANFDELDSLISSINFHRTKAKNIIAACQVIVQSFNGQVPQSIEELDSLPGIARKSANVILGDAFGIRSGITVDTHIIRLANCLGLTTSKDPVKIEQDLMQIVPHEKWTDFSHLLVLYGRYYCPARKSCCECELLADLCK